MYKKTTVLAEIYFQGKIKLLLLPQYHRFAAIGPSVPIIAHANAAKLF